MCLNGQQFIKGVIWTFQLKLNVKFALRPKQQGRLLDRCGSTIIFKQT